jgi:hypothetical protein
MRMKRFSLLLLALVFIASLAVVGCGGGGGGSTFTVSNLVISPATVETGTKVHITATVSNTGGASGNYTATVTIGGTAAGSQTVELAAGASTTVSFDYTPTGTGTLTVAIGGASGSLTVTPVTTGYWEIEYKQVEGAYLELYFSPGGITPKRKVIEFDETNGGTFILLVNKSVVDGAREVIMPAADYSVPLFDAGEVMTGITMDLLLTIDHDTTGTLYVEDGVGDVDMSSQSTAGQSPIQVDTQGDGTEDPAGSMLLPIPLVGNFETSVGQDGTLVFPLIYTTGHTDNTVHISMNKKMDGAFIEGDGALFEETGPLSPAPYVGTAGTITTTGTGNCLGIKLVGIRIDFQYLQVMKVEPVSVQ